MSRRIKTDFDPDFERVGILFNRAKGNNRTILKFSKAVGMNYAYMCRHMKGRVQKPLSPKSLAKVAAVACNGVTLRELLEASGYSAEKYIDNEEEERLTSKNEIIKKLDKKFLGRYSVEETITLNPIPQGDLVVLAGVILHYTEGGIACRRQGWGTHSVCLFMNLDDILPGAIDKALEMALDNATEGLLDSRNMQLIS